MSTEAVETWYIVDDATTHSGNTLTFKPSGGTGVSLVQGAKHILYSDGSTMFDVLDDCGNITANGTLDVAGNVNFNGGTFVFNEAGADKDFRIEGNTATHLIFTDAGNDRVGIKNASPSVELDVTGAIKATGNIDFDGGSFTFNDSSASVDFRIETNTLTHAFFSDGSADKIGFGTSSPTSAFVTIDQASSTGAIAVLTLDQGDGDQEFIRFDGTSASDSSASISSSTDEGGSKVGAIRVNINGTDRFIRIYDTAI